MNEERQITYGFNKEELMILDVGSGHRPLQGASVLLDKFIEAGGSSESRRDKRAVVDDRFVQGDIYDLPFGDKQFKFVVCLKVLAFLEDIEKALKELERVGQNGYLTVPTLWWGATGLAQYNLWMGHIDSAGKLWLIRRTYKAAFPQPKEFIKFLEGPAKRQFPTLTKAKRIMGYHWRDEIGYGIIQ